MIKKKPKLNFTDKKQGFAAVLIGIILALIIGISYNGPNWIYWLLIIGIIVGILNIFHVEGVLFMITGLTITFMLNVLAELTVFPLWAVTLFNAVIYVLAPATIIVSLKVLYSLAAK